MLFDRFCRRRRSEKYREEVMGWMVLLKQPDFDSGKRFSCVNQKSTAGCFNSLLQLCYVMCINNLNWWKDFHFYSAYPVYWPLKALYNSCHIHPCIHKLMAEAAMQGASCLSGAISGSVSCSRTVRHAAWFKPVTFRSLDKPLYLLSYSCQTAKFT